MNIELKEDDKLNFFSGNKIPKDSIPVALNYSGHQFGNFVHQLGDGRAILLGEVRNKNESYDIQLKGSGQTKVLKARGWAICTRSCFEEYILSEAMYHLGIPTTRSLAAVATGEHVVRDSFEPGGILTRVAKVI